MAIQTGKRLIVVLGMHRSGTSAITRALEVFGVSLGNNLLGPKTGDNEKGFFEDKDFNLFDRELEAVLKRNWHYVGPITEDDVQFLKDKGFLDRAVELINSKMANSAIFGFKDPRVSKLLPFWRKVFDQCGLDVSYVLGIRNPRSVVQSLIKRDGLLAEKGYLLWLTHTLPCLLCTSSDERVLVDYDVLLQNPRNEIKRIADSLELTINNSALELYLKDFLDAGLRHDLSDMSDMSSDEYCHPLVIRMYTRLLGESLSDQKHDKLGAATINEWAGEYGQIKFWLMLADKLDMAVDDQLKIVESLKEELALKVQAISNQNIYMEAKDQHIHHLKNEVEANHQHVGHLKNEIEANHQHVGHLKNEITAYRQQAAELEAHVKELSANIEMLDLQLVKIYGSLSWKITGPLRKILAFFKGD